MLVSLFQAGIKSQLVEWTSNYLDLYQNVNKRRLSLEKEVGNGFVRHSGSRGPFFKI